MRQPNSWPVRGRRLGLLALAMLSVGCQGGPKAVEGPTAADLRREAFQEHLTLSAMAVNGGALDEARDHLDHAREAAFSPSQRAKVDSLAHLIDGAETLMTGDVGATESHWSQIEDPALRRELEAEAAGAGIQLAGSEAME